MRLLDLIRREKVTVRVAGDVLVVTMAGTDFEITYERTDENRLVACSFRGRNLQDERRRTPLLKRILPSEASGC